MRVIFVNYQVPFGGIPNNMGPNFGNNMIPNNIMPNYYNYVGNTIEERVNLLEQKVQTLENKIKSMEKNNESNNMTDAFFQYKTSMHMM